MESRHEEGSFMRAPGSEQLCLILREMSRVTAVLALYCDRVEHNESSAEGSIVDAGRRLRNLAIGIAQDADLDLLELYAARLEEIEANHVYGGGQPTGDLVRSAKSWRELQIAQSRHDRWYHPDVFGLPRREQLQHVTLHLAKLTGRVASLYDDDGAAWLDFVDRRLPDMFLFGIKLATLGNAPLSDAVWPEYRPLQDGRSYAVVL